MAITIKDLAQMANTSTATVSRVLANKPGVTEEKRKRITELAGRLGYSPNRIAQNLALKKSHVLGLIAADLRNPVYIDFLRRMQSRVEEMGYQVLIADSEVNPEMEKHNIQIMRQHRAEGLIIFPVNDYVGQSETDHLLELKLQKFPFVILGRIEGFGFDCVTSEEADSAYRLTRHLLDLGHKRIGFVGHWAANRPARERLEGVQKALAQKGLELDERCIIPHGKDDEWVGGMTEMMRSSNRPTALVMINDTLALRAYRPMRELNLEIPRDVSLVAFGDSIWSRHLIPSLTTTQENNKEVTAIATEQLLKRLDNANLPPVQRQVPQEILVRESTAKPLLLLVAFILCFAQSVAAASTWIFQTNPTSPTLNLKTEVITSYPHDSSSFTQGLLLHDGKLYESDGLYSKSSLRRVDPQTGVVEMSVNVPDQYFAEGLELVGDTLVQLTWQEETALLYNVDTFEVQGTFTYTGQGWGLAYDGTHLIMSDGSEYLTFRDPATFEPLGQVAVFKDGLPVRRLNELEYVNGYLFANVWMTEKIVQIEPNTGRVVAEIDASGLLTPEESAGTNVLNGIAYDPDTGHFLITGKLWPKLFVVDFVLAE